MSDPDLFRNISTIAVVGLSDNPDRYSYQVAAYLQKQGFRIIPVNPNVKKVLGEASYPNLTVIPGNIRLDVVDIFRRSDEVMPHVEEAVKRGDAKIVWLQEGVENEEAEKYAEEHGLSVISNACIMKSHRKFRSSV